jgi:hypothetical protein
MLVKFTVDAGASGPRAEKQARPEVFVAYLSYLNSYDSEAEERARQSIRNFLDRNAAVTAAWIACTNRVKNEWYPEFEPLYDCLIAQGFAEGDAHAEAGKFLGLLVWNEMMAHDDLWHFTEYPKADSDYEVSHYFSVDAYIRARAKDSQAATARAHGDEAKAIKLEAEAKAFRETKLR